MAVFGRRKKNGPDGDGQDAPQEASTALPSDVEESAQESDAVDENERRRRSRLRPRDEVDLSAGPYDAAEAPERDGELDFGSLRITPTAEIELRLDVDENTQLLTGMTAVLGDGGTSAVQLQVFAAPKTSGIWYGIRREIAEAIVTGGGTAEEVEGPIGTELHVRMPAQGPDGRTTFSPARFVGVDGPRWFLRAVLSGEAALDEAAAEEAMTFVRSLVVNRGGEARAPRELLELTLPPELMAQAQQSQAAQGEQSGPGMASGPLERGPEMTETR